MPFSSNRQTGLVLLALWLMVFGSSSQIMIIAPILPQVGKLLHIPTALQGTLMTAYVACLAVFSLFIGPISDKVGRRNILLLGTGSMSLSLLLHGFAFDYTSFLLVRALSGVSGGMLSGVAVAYVGDYFPYEKRGWANGWVMSGIAFGQVLGIPLGIVLSKHMGYKAPFYLFALPMLLSFALVYFYVPQPNVQRSKQPLRFASSLRLYLKLILNPRTGAAILAYFLMFMSLMLFVMFMPTWLTQTLHISQYEIAGMYAAGGVANILTGPKMGQLSDRIGRKLLILISCLGMAVLMLISTFVLKSAWIGYMLYFITMMFVAMRMSPLQALLTALVPGEQRGTFMSLTVGIGQLGSSIGSAVAGLLFTHYGYLSNTVLSAILITLMGLLVWWRIPEPSSQAS